MAYRLDPAESLGESLRRAGCEQLDGALELLGEDGPPSPQAIHGARKGLKKARSLLRLAAPALGKRVVRRENAALREAGRLLSGTRDADVLVQTIGKLADRFAGEVPAPTFDALRTAAAARAAEGRAGDATVPAEEARALIAGARERAREWPLDDVRPRAIVEGLGRGYGRGREALANARRVRGEDPEVVHAWRKRVKDLWYHQRLLAPIWPDVVGAQAEAAHRLSELLGDDHDLAVLRDRVRAGDLAVEVDDDPIAALADRRRAELAADALRLGDRIYAESPRRFERRMRAYLRAWQDERAAS